MPIAFSHSYFFIFPRLRRKIKYKHFATVMQVKQIPLDDPNDMPVGELKNCFKQWKNCLVNLFVVNGGNIEDYTNLVLQY